jgi:hypothetical protein
MDEHLAASRDALAAPVDRALIHDHALVALPVPLMLIGAVPDERCPG